MKIKCMFLPGAVFLIMALNSCEYRLKYAFVLKNNTYGPLHVVFPGYSDSVYDVAKGQSRQIRDEEHTRGAIQDNRPNYWKETVNPFLKIEPCVFSTLRVYKNGNVRCTKDFTKNEAWQETWLYNDSGVYTLNIGEKDFGQ
ncbi:MAG: hypothetical protein JWO06_1018 [Bacteroidota bacterium]|nr:hypothetical protein [Bacteroidota bacterium]